MWEDVDDLLCKINKEDEEIEKMLPWFYETVKCFKQVKQEPVKEIIRKSEYAPIRKDHVIIRQGEVGDCCYIILRGTVTVYARRTEDIDHLILEEPATRVTVVKTHKDRAKFGAEVSVLRGGDKFGDLCFYKSNGERNATVIADDNLYLLVVDKHVYQTNLAEQFVDMKDQLRFMETSQLFKRFPYDYRITLLEKMSARRINYGCSLVRQGDPVMSIFIVCRGEALLKVNPTKLSQQYQLQASGDTPSVQPRPLTVIQRRREILRNGYAAGEKLLKQQNITIATVGPNEIIGDVEFMLNLATHHVTATCNSSMLVMEMEMTELHRLILKRDVGMTDYLHASVLPKLNGRANRCTDVPQYRDLYKMGLKVLKLKQANAQGNNRGEGSRKSTLVKVSNLIKLSKKLAVMEKVKPKAAPEVRSGSIVSALKKTVTVALEIAGGNRTTNKLVDLTKKLQEGLETTGQDDVTGTRTNKGKTRKEGQVQEKGKKQFTVKEYRVLKKKMQAAGKTIRPSD